MAKPVRWHDWQLLVGLISEGERQSMYFEGGPQSQRGSSKEIVRCPRVRHD